MVPTPALSIIFVAPQGIAALSAPHCKEVRRSRRCKTGPSLSFCPPYRLILSKEGGLIHFRAAAHRQKVSLRQRDQRMTGSQRDIYGMFLGLFYLYWDEITSHKYPAVCNKLAYSVPALRIQSASLEINTLLVGFPISAAAGPKNFRFTACRGTCQGSCLPCQTVYPPPWIRSYTGTPPRFWAAPPALSGRLKPPGHPVH